MYASPSTFDAQCTPSSNSDRLLNIGASHHITALSINILKSYSFYSIDGVILGNSYNISNIGTSTFSPNKFFSSCYETNFAHSTYHSLNIVC